MKNLKSSPIIIKYLFSKILKIPYMTNKPGVNYYVLITRGGSVLVHLPHFLGLN